VVVVHARHDRSQRTVDERKRNYSDEHDDNREYSFNVGVGGNVSIADSGDGGNSPVESQDIDLDVVIVDVREVSKPRVFVLVLIVVVLSIRSELAGHEPQAGSDMAHDHENEEEEDESLDAVAHSEDVVDVVHQRLLVLYDPYQTQQLGQFDQFVQSTYFRDSNDIVGV